MAERPKRRAVNPSRNDPAEYRDLMRRLNHATTANMTLSDIAWLMPAFQRQWWSVQKNRRGTLRPWHDDALYDGLTIVERLRAIAEKCGV